MDYKLNNKIDERVERIFDTFIGKESTVTFHYGKESKPIVDKKLTLSYKLDLKKNEKNKTDED